MNRAYEMLRRFLILIGLGICGTAAADPVKISGAMLQKLVPGSTVNIDTPLKAKLPVKYNEDGTISAHAGALAFYLGSNADHGRWWILGGNLCQKWDKWFDAETSCMELSREGTKIWWRKDDGREGTATLIAAVAPTTSQPKSVAQQSAPNRVQTVAAKAAPGNPKPVIATKPVVAPMPKLASRPAAPVAKPTLVQQANALVSPTLVSFRVAGVAADDVLNVRTGPAPNYPVIATVPPHARGVNILGQCVQDWCRVRYKSASGWVNRRYLMTDAAIAGFAQRVRR